MYTKEVKLNHNEGIILFNKESGEPIREIPTTSKKTNPHVSLFDNGKFIKHHTQSWKLLETQTTNFEYAIATKMSNKIKMITNSLEPLSDETTVRELSEEFNISIGKVKLVFDKLFKLSVYAKFEVSEYKDEEFRHMKYWVFNPFLSCNGVAIDDRSKGLFSNTTFAKL